MLSVILHHSMGRMKIVFATFVRIDFLVAFVGVRDFLENFLGLADDLFL